MFSRPLLASLAAITLLTAGCGLTGGDDSSAETDEPSEVAAENATDETQSPDTVADSSSDVTTVDTGTDPVAAPEVDDHDDPADHEWSADDASTITFDGSGVAVDGPGVAVDGSIATIDSAGTYVVQGATGDGQLVVSTDDEEVVRVVLDGADIANSSGSPFVVADASEVVVILADGTTNVLTDADTYVFPDAETDEPNAALFSTADLTVTGTGTLVVDANYNDGVASKDGLVIDAGTIEVTAADDAIRGKDYLVIRSGELLISAGGDGLKSDNDDADLGAITVVDTVAAIEAAGDGLAANHVSIEGGSLTIVAGGGHTASLGADVSAKGIKGTISVTITAGIVTADAADDAVHSNDTVTVSGGTLELATGDDGIHADANVVIDGGTIIVTDSYEGIESAVIDISDGIIDVTASDDGLNVAGGADGSGFEGGGPGRGGRDAFEAVGDYHLSVSGGDVTIDAEGDGFDSNGTASVSGGTIIVYGPSGQGNGAIDVNGSFEISGGTLLAGGSAGMAETPDGSSSQAFVAFSLRGSVAGGSTIQILASDGTEIASYQSAKPVEAFVASSPEVIAGAAYEVVIDGESLGTVTA